jgi:hypothetical protein
MSAGVFVFLYVSSVHQIEQACLVRKLPPYLSRIFLYLSRSTYCLFRGKGREFVSICRELSLVPLKELTNGALRRALETIFRLFDDTNGVKSTLQLAV